MGNLEQGPMVYKKSREAIIPSEIEEMDANLVQRAKKIFENNHELVKEAMFGMGNRKAKEVLEDLAQNREYTKNAVMRWRKTKKDIYGVD